ncbi:hypothetical protein Aph01nite_65860 [Acrocarpospora phusangensis]|uniref:Uncharacterized protein n=1 Tax=Acrocarpospora phusangensis TaxID=1070424 RepID=A0A919UNA2_9ACTN|nr:hypothetical protein Aph01nite_65860 [Acrocarpospora phusangensis]
MSQPAVQDIEIHLRSDLPDMGWDDHGGTAQIKRDNSRNSGGEIANRATESIVKAETHLPEGKRPFRLLSIGFDEPGAAHHRGPIVRHVKRQLIGRNHPRRPASMVDISPFFR